MLSNIVHQVKSFIFSDVKNETETKELAILLRFLSAVYAVYYLSLTMILAWIGYYIAGLIMLFSLGLMVSSFICTYEDKTRLSFYITSYVILTNAIWLTFVTGWQLNFQWSILIVILIHFFDVDLSLKKKFKFTIVIGSIFLSITIFSHYYPVVYAIHSSPELFLQLINVTLYLLSLFFIAYSYCNKFNQSEEKLRAINKKLLHMASKDALTGLANRRSMNEHLVTLAYDYTRIGKNFSIAIGDVDFFKHINDDYGHETGDSVLTTLSELFHSSMKDKGVVSRWGGEEFLFTFEGMSSEQAYSHLEALRHKIETTTFHSKNEEFHISMTFGLEEYESLLGVESTISHADQKLYKGKEKGRNLVIF